MPDYNRIAAKLAFIDSRSASRDEREARIAAALRSADKTGAERTKEAASRAIEMAKIWDNMAIGRAAATLRVIRGLPDTPE